MESHILNNITKDRKLNGFLLNGEDKLSLSAATFTHNLLLTRIIFKKKLPPPNVNKIEWTFAFEKYKSTGNHVSAEYVRDNRISRQENRHALSISAVKNNILYPLYYWYWEKIINGIVIQKDSIFRLRFLLLYSIQFCIFFSLVL